MQSEKYLTELYQECNKTELYQLCRRSNLPARAGDPRETLIALLTGELERAKLVAPLNDWRDAIMRFVDAYWHMLATQLKCPAKTRNPRACYGCLDQQVIACLVENEANLDLIRKYKENK